MTGKTIVELSSVLSCDSNSITGNFGPSVGSNEYKGVSNAPTYMIKFLQPFIYYSIKSNYLIPKFENVYLPIIVKCFDLFSNWVKKLDLQFNKFIT